MSQHTGGHTADGAATGRWLPGRCDWLTLAAVLLLAASVLPPLASYARQLVFAESLQFALLAIAVPALMALGAPWRFIALDHALDRLSRSRAGRPGFLRSMIVLFAWVAVCVGWRLPAAVDALVSQPGWVALEVVTLLVAGTALWLELVSSPPSRPRLTIGLRAVVAALAMWSVWVQAYILGFSHVAWFRSLSQAGASGLGVVADQEIAAGILWAVAAICFTPVVFYAALSWLTEPDDPDAELRQVMEDAQRREGSGPWPRAPRGWRSSSG